MMGIFFAYKKNDGFFLDENEIHHLKVLRIKLPGRIKFTDGRGFLYEGVVNEDFKIVSHKSIKNNEREFINLFFGICEKSRMKFILEKCTEIGINGFYPIFTEKSSKTVFSKTKAESILKSAVKQSRRFLIPEYNEPVDLKNMDEKYFSNAYFGSIEKTDNNDFDFKNEINVFIGPPSGFSEQEEIFLKQKGVKPFHLETGILRTETFAVSVVSIIHYLKGLK